MLVKVLISVSLNIMIYIKYRKVIFCSIVNFYLFLRFIQNNMLKMRLAKVQNTEQEGGILSVKESRGKP